MVSNEFPYPGISTTTDGTGAVVWVEAHIVQAVCAYPITPSTNMAVGIQMEIANGKRNLWNEEIGFLELESEHSSASTCEGYALSGGRVTNFTSGQGLILMKEVLYTIAGKRLPVVFHIAARALTSQALNIHAGHDDVMAVTDVGWGMLFAKNAQEAGDFALISRRTAEDSHIPFLNVQDGFITSHTIESVVLPEPEMMKKYIGLAEDKLINLMDVYNPIQSGVVQNQDSYMKGKISQRHYYEKLQDNLKNAMDEFYKLTGRRYNLIEKYRLDDAEYVVVAMGSTIETAMATVDYLRDKENMKVGALNVSSFRPFPGKEIVDALKKAKAISVIERMDNPIAQSNPLTAEIKASFADALSGTEGYPKISTIPVIYSGSGGLGSRDVTPRDIRAVIENMQNGGKRYFALGITHPLSIETKNDVDLRTKGFFAMRGHSVGGFGSVTTNKVIASVVAELFGFYVQAYPKYGSEKKGLPTNYYLAVSPDKIRTHNELDRVNFVPLNDANAFNIGNPLVGLEEMGLLFVHTTDENPETLWKTIPGYAKAIIHDKKIRVLGLDTIRIARASATSADLVQRMQGIVLLGIFLKSTPYEHEFGITKEKIFEGVENILRKYFGKRGDQVVKDNLDAATCGYNEVFEISRDLIESDQAAIQKGREHPKAKVVLGNRQAVGVR
ncbi:MAG: 2-oxoacid:acceptor oxidoreductase family protein [Spirochaetota bacterium]|nr:2-oxoacid:acceptor oxidoreductase family protein [Spirochaetota bacterium]